MRQFVIPIAAVAALAFVAADATPAKAQVIVTSGYSPYSYGGYSPYYGSGLVLGNGGLGFNASPLYGGFAGGYGGYYGYGYPSNYSTFNRPYYGGTVYGSRRVGGTNRGFIGGRRR